MASVSVDAPTSVRTRGKSKAPNWVRPPEVAVIALELDVSGDSRTLARLEAHYEAVFRLRRAVQRDARTAARGYLSAKTERTTNPKALRARLGLSRKAVEARASRHVDDAKWMRAHLTKATALHVADEVWETCDRFLFPDAAGRKAGVPRVGDWWDFTRIPGRAKSHTKAQPTWETYRLVGSLQGHLDTLGGGVTVAEAACMPVGTTLLTQPRTLPAPVPQKNWWRYDGPLAVVYTGLAGGDLVMPVRLPQGAGRFSRLAHFLADPALWHKIDLVRIRDHAAPGGWRYAAHLTVLTGGYQSEATQARRAAVPQDRRAGVDGNVSNIAVASFAETGDITTTYLAPTPEQRATAARAAKKARARARALERSRRASNRDQYGLSKKQAKRTARRAAAGLPEKVVEVPKGARAANARGVPTRAYRRDALSSSYRKTRAVHAQEAGAATQRSHAYADQIAAQVIALHGPYLVTEDINVRSWMHLWGKALAVTTPGRVLAAIRTEAEACGGTMTKASTFTTALSQHCLCGRREKKPLSQRTHICPDCGLVADRDLLAATLAACVTFANPTDPRTARLNPNFTTALAARVGAQQEALVRSTTSQPKPHSGVRDGERGSNQQVAPAGHGNMLVLPQHNLTVSLEQTTHMNPRKQLRINS